ncbi:GNAT family N-acetyltransferase [Oenococcus kitaharae]|uniref:GNAT family N-acetyltransferase n=1 Tax=Oenococcus TaxID=46254 RepID=UPI0021E7AC7A|nr:GNAT family N-acetyltransferase [Oenococcus kitaharae]MCV3295575.1 GNAT family N-acetyltransferase [Oenococcus kitaharae]
MAKEMAAKLALRLMTSTEFDQFVSKAIKDYAVDKVQAGSWLADEAMKKSEESFNSLLPQDINSPDNYLYSIIFQKEKIGILWMAKLKDQPDTIFIYDFAIDDAFQNQGFGSKALVLADEEARKLSFKHIALHVFGRNARALHVYQKSGYGITDINMQKDL